MSYTELVNYIDKKFKGRFNGSLNWYVEIIKLDLEARKIIKNIPKTKPQLYKIR